MPRFSIDENLSLAEIMAGLGAPSAFGATADLRGIADVSGLHVSTAVHRALIEVDEQGTTAAAATAIVMSKSARHGAGAIDMIADHPLTGSLSARWCDAEEVGRQRADSPRARRSLVADVSTAALRLG